MQADKKSIGNFASKDIMDIVMRVALIAILAFVCIRIFSPFTMIVLWGLVLAVALYPLHKILAKALGGRQGRSASIIVIIGLLFIGGPSTILGISMAGHTSDVYSAFNSDAGIHIDQPEDSVADWPLVGTKIHSAWSSAADNLPAFVAKNKIQLKNFMDFTISTAANTMGTIFMSMGALIIAGIMMAYGESGSRSLLRIICRMSNVERGTTLHKLSTATIRSVATGVIGVAVIQALLLGVGFMGAGIPAAGVLALIVLVLGIAQLPALLISIPAIAWIWGAGDAGTTSNIIFSVYILIAGMADNFLKPLLLGRGVDAPMPIILIGAIGGMITSGLIGLFLGAVLLAIGYQIFMEWVDEIEDVPAATADSTHKPTSGE
jgi:predicted PurR-regulated permease PerM